MNKRKLMLVAVALCMVAILGFGGTLAYLTDTDHQVNTFTTGHVDLELDESEITTGEDGEYTGVTENRTSDSQTYKVFPADVVTKDPRMTLSTESEDAYMAAKMVVTGNLYSLIGVEDYTNLDITKIISGGLAGETTKQETYNGLWGYGNDKFFIYQDVTKVDVVDDPATEAVEGLGEGEEGTWTFYIFVKEIQQPGAEHYLFTTLTIPSEWDSPEMKLFNASNIDITAYAVQADGFDSCYEAMTEAEFFSFN